MQVTRLGVFARGDFVYDAAADHYTCPAGAHLTKGVVRSDHSGDIDHYRNLTACQNCAPQASLHAREGHTLQALEARGRA